MPTRAGVGLSREIDSARAGDEAVRVACERAGIDRPDLALVYATIRHDPIALAAGAVRAARGGRVLGCSAQGVSVAGHSEESGPVVAAMAISSSALSFDATMVRGVGADARRAALAAARALRGSEPPAAIFCHWDPLTGVDVDGLIGGLLEAGTKTLVGGAAAQTWGPVVTTWQFDGTDVAKDALLAVAMRGGEAIVDTSHGAEPMGLSMRVTHADKNALLELDGRRALDVWREMVDQNAVARHGATTAHPLRSDDVGACLLGLPLPADAPAHYGGCMTRAIFGTDEARGAIVLQTQIPEGSEVMLCHRTHEAVRGGARALGHRLRAELAGKRPVFALGFECGGRTSPFLGERASAEEADEVRELIGPAIPWLGMYAWGEIAPVGRHVLFHQLTFPLAVFCEAPVATGPQAAPNPGPGRAQ